MSNPPRSDSTVVVATAYPLPSSVRSRAAPSPLAQRRSKLAQQQAQAGPSNRLNDRGVPSAHSLNAESLANASQLGSAPGSRVSSRTNFLASRSSVGLGGGSLSAPNPAIGNTSANSTTSFASTSTLAAPLLAPTGGQAGRLIESAGPDIVERPRDRTRNHEVAASSLAFLYSEMVQYVQGRVSGIAELEKRLSLMGYTMGQKLLAMTSHRLEMSTNGKNPKREVRLLPVLLWVHTHLWKQAFGKSADSLERSTERNDECESWSRRHVLKWNAYRPTRSARHDLYQRSFLLQKYLHPERHVTAQR